MKKILFIIGACLTLTFASCTCKTTKTDTPVQDTIFVEDTVFEETFDTVEVVNVVNETADTFVEVIED